MTKHAIYSLGIVLLFILQLKAQDSPNNKILGITGFKAAKENQASRAAELQEVITEVLSSKKYITLLDRSKTAQLEEELKRQKQGNYVEGVTVAQNKSYGSKEALNGSLSNIDVDVTHNNVAEHMDLLTKKKVPASSETSYKARISFALQIVDVETGKLISEQTFNLNSNGSGFLKFDSPPTYSSSESAVNNAVKDNHKNIVKLVNNWINSVYPPPLSIAIIDTRDKKGFPATVSLVGGTEANLSSGNDLAIYEVHEVDVNGEKKLKKIEIGALRVKEMQGDFTSCKVTSGEELLESKWKENVIQIIVKPKK